MQALLQGDALVGRLARRQLMQQQRRMIQNNAAFSRRIRRHWKKENEF